jgi:hypothetical protein
MNSPQPLSAPQRGAKKDFFPFFCLQENPACGIDEVNGADGDEYMLSKTNSQINIIYFL